jgi:hypothetical protein
MDARGRRADVRNRAAGVFPAAFLLLDMADKENRTHTSLTGDDVIRDAARGRGLPGTQT